MGDERRQLSTKSDFVNYPLCIVSRLKHEVGHTDTTLTISAPFVTTYISTMDPPLHLVPQGMRLEKKTLVYNYYLVLLILI